ncbi:MAG: SAM-dependent methyltransferase [Spirochaetes bacterium]|nr:SAM-dependent methyltransferase [Spirochaetota bacterium]
MINPKDSYYRKAKHDNYPARSVYKLEEIDRRYRLVKNGMRVVDFGCVPGSWSKYLLKRIGNGTIVGIDVADPPAIRDGRFTYMKEDILSIDTKRLKERIGTVDLILSDACPSTSGNRFSDGQASLEIVRRVFSLAPSILKPGGSVVAKVLTGEDTAEFVRKIRPGFESVRQSKPKASRKESREMYIIALHQRREF